MLHLIVVRHDNYYYDELSGLFKNYLAVWIAT